MYLGYFLEGESIYRTALSFSYEQALQELADLLREMEDDEDELPANEEAICNYAKRIALQEPATAGVMDVSPGRDLLALARQLICLETRDEALLQLQLFLDHIEGVRGGHERLCRHSQREAQPT